jgi:hypothetical protein
MIYTRRQGTSAVVPHCTCNASLASFASITLHARGCTHTSCQCETVRGLCERAVCNMCRTTQRRAAARSWASAPNRPTASPPLRSLTKTTTCLRGLCVPPFHALPCRTTSLPFLCFCRAGHHIVAARAGKLWAGWEGRMPNGTFLRRTLCSCCQAVCTLCHRVVTIFDPDAAVQPRGWPWPHQTRLTGGSY